MTSTLPATRKVLWLSVLALVTLWSLPACSVGGRAGAPPSDGGSDEPVPAARPLPEPIVLEPVSVEPIPDNEPAPPPGPAGDEPTVDDKPVSAGPTTREPAGAESPLMTDDRYDETFVKSIEALRLVRGPAPPLDAGLDAVDYVIDRLPRAGVAFNNVPDSLKRGKRVLVELVVSATATGAVLRDMVQAEGAVIDTVAPVGRDLHAHLISTSDGLIVKSTTLDQSRTLRRTREARWSWWVTAREGGQHDLNLTLNTTITLGDERREIEIESFRREISVFVSPGQRVAAFVGEHWELLFGSVVVPIAGFGWRTWRRPRTADRDREPGGGRRRKRRPRS